VWRYDKNLQISDYTVSNLDLTTMADVGAGDPRIWVHIVSAWVISWFAWRVRGAPRAGRGPRVPQGLARQHTSLDRTEPRTRHLFGVTRAGRSIAVCPALARMPRTSMPALAG